MRRFSKIVVGIIFFIFIVTIACVFFTVNIIKKHDRYNEGIVISQKKENEISNDLEVVNTSFSGIKITPSTVVVFKKLYKKCNHEEQINEKAKQSIVNMNEEELQNYYSDWTIKQFSKNQIVLYKEFDGYCNNHYLIKEQDGFVKVFKVEEDGTETLIQDTSISLQYLPETDRLNIKQGMMVYKKEDLNKILEDLE